MQKVVLAVIQKDNQVLLMRCNESNKNARKFEYPGGKAENGVRIVQTLKHKLKEKLNIDAEIGKLITTVKHGGYEVYFYNVKSYTGTIDTKLNSGIEWMPVDKISKQSLLPADREITLKISDLTDSPKKLKNSELDLQAHIFAFSRIRTPFFDFDTQSWCFESMEQNTPQKKYFSDKNEALVSCLAHANKIMADFKTNAVRSGR